MRNKLYTSRIAIILCFIILVTWLFIFRLPICQDQTAFKPHFPSQPSDSQVASIEPWQMPDWVQRYNLTHLFDWTWDKNDDFVRCRVSTVHSPQPIACRIQSTTIVNDVLSYFDIHSDKGCIVDNVVRLPNFTPHPLPRARSLSNTCSSLNIDHKWTLCKQSQSELDQRLPATTRFVTIAVFNAYIDTGYCHSQLPGTIFTEHATFHFQSWTNNPCYNDPIFYIPRVHPEHQYTELIDSIGIYLQAPGHFVPEQLPRLLRLLATAPKTAKVLVAKGGIADSLIDVLVERGIVTRDRIIPYDNNNRPYYFANIVYRSESWPYLTDKNNSHHLYDRTDMQLVHRALATDGDDNQQSKNKRNLVILIKRKDGDARSIIEHLDMVAFINSRLKKSKKSLDLHLEIFEAEGHVRDHIALFRRARIIVGPHGAGMLNVVWSSAGTYVVEVGYNEGMTFPEMYAEMSLHLEQHYWICKGYGNYDSPIHVDMDDFIYIFNEIIHEIEVATK
ncbi:unnamed protein product [Adineta steineri]|uniref:Glycosyltransferase 61 catalytic domain-containing protein n=2 Tax=Adineta steineri TaxID=433720 RepID=A0A813RKG9_9BILA|nr:unnamed protein product [Adineta steineri]